MNNKLDDLKEIRRKNLHFFCTEKRKRAELSSLMECHPSYITNLINGIKPITEKGARKLEKAMNKPFGWLDMPISDSLNNYSDTKELPISHKFDMENEASLPIANLSQLGINKKAGERIPKIKLNQAASWRKAPDLPGAGEIMFYEKVGKNAFAVDVDSDSMADVFSIGETLLIDPDIPAAHKKYVLAEVKGDIVLRQYWREAGEERLVSSDPKRFKDIPAEDFAVIGVVVYAFTLRVIT